MPHSNSFCYEFGPFKLNVRERLLTRDGEAIALTPKATDILLVLLKNAGELVTKEVLMTEVWPDSFVEEANLTQNVFQLRRSLGDQRASAQFIETVARRGYRFVAVVKREQGFQAGVEPTIETPSALDGLDRPPRLAVLPFVNATGDQSFEYLAEGISDNLINSLSQISKLRVMSRSAVFRFKGRDVEPKLIAKELRIDAMLLGKIILLPSGLVINVELVDVGNGWQLWGKSFECELSQIVEIQNEIVRQISTSLKLTLTGDEGKRITARYTDNSQAYQAYLEGRFHWSRYTRTGIEQAIEHFRKAIEMDPNYALAYAGVVDCYLRLATNYLPALSVAKKRKNVRTSLEASTFEPIERKVKLRHEWDWKGAERELRRATELRTEYPSAHQWHAAYLFVRKLYQDIAANRSSAKETTLKDAQLELPAHIPSGVLTPAEEVQVLCAIAREQIDVGNYQAARLVLNRWWHFGLWPKSTGLDQKSRADLLFTVGELAGFVASAEQLPLGQKHAETLLSGSMALFEQLGSNVRLAEARNELALCYYRQGNFDLSRDTFLEILSSLSADNSELRGLTLIRLASLERHAGRLQDALARLTEAKEAAKVSGPWVSGRHHLELASTYKDLAISEEDDALFSRSLENHLQALHEFESVGNLRLSGIAENNLGFLFLLMGRLKAAKSHLSRAGRMFEVLEDKVRQAQVSDTLARLHVEEHQYGLAEEATNQAIETLQHGDEDALLAEVLRTKGIVFCKLARYVEASRILQRSHDIAARCGDREGAGLALLILIEEMRKELSVKDCEDIAYRLQMLLVESQQSSLRVRVQKALELIQTSHDDEV